MLTDWRDKILHFWYDSLNPFVVGIIEGPVNRQVCFFCQLAGQWTHFPFHTFEGVIVKFCPVLLLTGEAVGNIRWIKVSYPRFGSGEGQQRTCPGSESLHLFYLCGKHR